MKKIEVIGMPMKYGCMVDGADLSYEYLKDSLEKVLEVKCDNVVDTSYENPVIHLKNKKMKYVEPVMDISKRLYDKVYKSIKNGNMPLIVGGDHSTCIGSISAALDSYEGDVSVIYIDEHADIHTDETSPSGNMHGIPLSICLGRCNGMNIGTHKLKNENLYYIGLYNYEKEEIDYIENNNICHYLGKEVEEKNEDAIVEEIRKRINTKHVHISLDFDCLINKEFNAFNVAVEKTYDDENGMSVDKLKKFLKLLFSNLDICSMDIVEYNPLLDKDFKCRKKIEEILEVIK